MNKPWMPVVAGILDIVSGAMGVLMGLGMSLYQTFAGAAQGATGAASRFGPFMGGLPHLTPAFFPGMGFAMGITLAVLGVLAIVGGIFALRTKAWGLALAGSISAVLTGRLLGVLALIFTVLGRKDFQK